MEPRKLGRPRRGEVATPRTASERGIAARSTVVGALKGLVYSLRNNARRRGYICEINPDDIIALWEKQHGLCALTGFAMTLRAGEGRLRTACSVDRINNNVGYTLENIHLVCWFVNKWKSTLSMQEFHTICQQIAIRSESYL